MDEIENLRKKLNQALLVKEAGQRILKKSNNTNENSFQKYYKTLLVSTRLVKHYEKKIDTYVNDSTNTPIKPIGSGCYAMIKLNFPVITNDLFKTRKNEYKNSLHVYIEATYNDDIFQSELYEIDQNTCQILHFNILLSNIEPQTKINFSLYSCVLKTNDHKRSIGSRKSSSSTTIQDANFDLYATYICTLISLVRKTCFEMEIHNRDNPLANYMEYNNVFSALITIYPKKYTKLKSKNKVVIITVKEILNMDEEGDEFSFLTLYWNIENGLLKFYFDVYLSRCLDNLTTSLNEIEELTTNELEHELTITTTTHIITLLIENDGALDLTKEIIEKVINMGQSWPTSLISFPKSCVEFLKSALSNNSSSRFFDTIGTPISYQPNNF